MRNPWGMVAGLGGALLAVSSPAAAQSPPPFDSAIDVQTFEYAIGPKTFFTVSDGDIASPKQLAVDAMVTYLTKPFSIYNYDPSMPDTVGDERTVVVKNLTAMQITAAYGVNEKLQIGANLPVIFQLSGDGLMPETGSRDPNGLSVTGLGDMMVEGKYRLYAKGLTKVSGLGGISLPTSFGSDGSQFIGDNLPTVRLRVAASYDTGRFAVGANGGFLFRKPRTIYDSTIGQQFVWGVAAAARLTDRFSIIAESYGRAGLPDFSLDASPLEVEAGLRLFATQSVSVVLGGGAGLVRGIGSPESRFFLSVGYSPDVRDSDMDGIPNSRDKCPLVPEDRDGDQDDDGCPDDDGDGDRRPDAEDKCPTVAEDLDGFEDDDGCPELDNDGDKIDDMADKCPNDAEDGKQPYPNDGCPGHRRDSDGDSIYDNVDACPMEEEDLDGFEDGDGCPEADNDADGVTDASDKCSLCPEDKDGFEDNDGCPDLDNDGDKIDDMADKCPNDAEDGKQPYPNDGCPGHRRDSDGDGIYDNVDACPMEEEDLDGFEDGDGCPEADNDADGVPDANDKCPLCPEDKDGFEDDDGCPDLDNDKDGIADARDACPAEAETINGIKDDDGCPDTGGVTVAKMDGDRLAIDKVPALDRTGLTKAGILIVDQMALVMLQHPEVTKWLIAVSQPKADNATKLADAIKARLVAKGVPADTLQVLGAQGPAKIGGVVQERASEDGPPVCPAGREVTPRPEASKAAPAPTPAAPVESTPAESTPAPDQP